MSSTSVLAAAPIRAAYFVSDSTGVTAETLGNALLANFPGIRFFKRTIPFVVTEGEAKGVVASIAADAAAGRDPLLFITVKQAALRGILSDSKATLIDLLAGHLTELEQALGTTASDQLGNYHGLGDTERYFARMRAVEYAIEHDDGQSARALDQA